MAAADQAPKADPLPEEEPPDERIAPGIPPASAPGVPAGMAEPGQRLLARIVDTLVVGLPVMVVVREVVPADDVDIVAPPAVAALLLLYEWIQLALWGRTLGKRFAGIEVVREEAPEGESEPAEGISGPAQGASGPAEGVAGGEEPVPAVPEDVAAPAVAEGVSEGAGEVPEGSEGVSGRAASVSEGRRLGVTRSLLRSVTYALPIAARPVPVFGVIAGLFWVGNSALMYEGTRRQALHDRLAGTLVVKRATRRHLPADEAADEAAHEPGR